MEFTNMKTEKKNGQRAYLQARNNNRWKWMAGAAASQAALVTISLSNNYLGQFENNLNADLTGDGHPDLTIANVSIGWDARVSLNGVQAYFHFRENGQIIDAYMVLGTQRAFYHYNFQYSQPTSRSGTPSLTGSIPVFFKDLRINGGTPTEGPLKVTVSPFYISLDSLTYNTPVHFSSRSVPDQ